MIPFLKVGDGFCMCTFVSTLFSGSALDYC